MAFESQIEGAVRAAELAQRRRHTMPGSMASVLSRSETYGPPTAYCVFGVCAVLVDERKLCCPSCWALVPAPLRRGYERTYVAGQNPSTATEANKQAVAAIVAWSLQHVAEAAS